MISRDSLSRLEISLTLSHGEQICEIAGLTQSRLVNSRSSCNNMYQVGLQPVLLYMQLPVGLLRATCIAWASMS